MKWGIESALESLVENPLSAAKLDVRLPPRATSLSRPQIPNLCISYRNRIESNRMESGSSRRRRSPAQHSTAHTALFEAPAKMKRFETKRKYIPRPTDRPIASNGDCRENAHPHPLPGCAVLCCALHYTVDTHRAHDTEWSNRVLYIRRWTGPVGY